LAHRELEAGIIPDLAGFVPWFQTTKPPGIITLQPDDVRSMRPRFREFNGSGIEYAQSVANGKFNDRPRPARWDMAAEYFDILPFSYEDLQNPVPARVYYDARPEDCWATQSHCGTITDDTYRPLLALKNRVWASYLPEGFGCMRPDIVDPPIALQPAYDTNLPIPTIHASPTIKHPPMPNPTGDARPGNIFPGSISSPTAASQNAPFDPSEASVVGESSDHQEYKNYLYDYEPMGNKILAEPPLRDSIYASASFSSAIRVESQTSTLKSRKLPAFNNDGRGNPTDEWRFNDESGNDKSNRDMSRNPRNNKGKLRSNAIKEAAFSIGFCCLSFIVPLFLHI
jgi:hypothetical protein